MHASTAARSHAEHADAPRDASIPRSVDELLDLDAPALEALYRGARVPDLAAIHGDLRGRMLAIPALRGAAAALPRAFARTAFFPWRGKSFRPKDALHGEGINRVFSDRIRLYRFETYIDKSRAGDFDAVQLNYDLPSNPFFIRPIKDEIRELRPGLYLGQAYLETRQGASIGTPKRSEGSVGRARLVLYFGLQA